MSIIPMTFPISIFELEDNDESKVSETLTKKRVGIFYRGANRNGGYISDEFAEKLLSTLAYAPVKGIYDEEEEDFTTHGSSRDQGRIYGVVPENFNFAWEKHMDDDGVEREYACADVYLYTALYKEANEIGGKGQSMELYPPSIKGSWIKIDGKEMFKYTDACFLGLQVLGDNAIPCFEGSSFFTINSIENLFSLYQSLNEKIDKFIKGGNDLMENENIVSFALSDSQKQNQIFKCLNKSEYKYYVLDTYDEYAIVYNFKDEKTYRVNYKKNEDDTVKVAEDMEEVTAVYVNADERKALNECRTKANCETFTEMFTVIENNEKTITDLKNDFDMKVNELSTLNTEKENLENVNTDLTAKVDAFTASVDKMTTQISEYEAKIADLETYKSNIENANKQAVIDKYSKKLSADVIAIYTEKLSEYTVESLTKELAYELVKADESIFSLNEEQVRVPVEAAPTGLASILSKYKK